MRIFRYEIHLYLAISLFISAPRLINAFSTWSTKNNNHKSTLRLQQRAPETFIKKSSLYTPIRNLASTDTSTEEEEKTIKEGKKNKATLTDETTWKVRIQMKNVPTSKGRRVDPFFVLDIQFIEDINYEPPQGTIKQVNNINGASISRSSASFSDTASTEDADSISTKTTKPATALLQINKGRWQLSEDPNDRKDGLWVWGLFKEPLYPFFLLTLETSEIILPGSINNNNNDGPDSIAPLKLFCQVSHQREDDKGAILGSGTLNIREIETVKVDPFGGATVDIYEEVGIGQISFVPL